MNYLAHAFLSLNDPEIMVGNMMGDFIKGKQYLQYEGKIRQGMLLHRSIDFYTDKHPLILEATALLKPSLRLTGGIFVDILFDHFLANDNRYFQQASLEHFTLDVYRNLDQHKIHYNDKMLELFTQMAAYNWLYNYRLMEGLQRSILGICKRYPLLGDGQIALATMLTNYDRLLPIYQNFFPELLQHVMAQPEFKN